MNAEIIAVGSELLLGQIANTNAQFLSKQLAELGIDVYYHTAVGDNRGRLEDAIVTAQKRADILIFCGGLGPTQDDLTKETVAATLKRHLLTDDTALTRIRAYFQKRQQTMTENNKKQAVIIEGSRVLENKSGMAPGMALTSGGQTYMLFPGPPRELEPMFRNDGKTYLQQQLHTGGEHIISRVLRFFDIGESQLETELLDLIESQTNPTLAPLAGTGEVTLRLTAKSPSADEARPLLDRLETSILQRIGSYFYGYGETTLAKETFNTLTSHNLTLACAESLSGGRFAGELTDVAGASSVFKGGVVCYTNEIKENVLRVPAEVLQTDGAVSEACARILAENARDLANADLGISFTGVAGPDPSEGKEVGTVYIGIADKQSSEVYPLTLAGGRRRIRMQSAHYGFFYLIKQLRAADPNYIKGMKEF